jgi:type IV secretory pathway TraG/TraD family ATPase VirD4
MPWISGVRPCETESLAYKRFDLLQKINACPPEHYLMGLGKRGCPVTITETDRSMHIQVIGSPGTGKTTAVLLPLLAQDIAAGKGGVFVEPKGSQETVDVIKAIARDHGRLGDIRLFSLSRPEISEHFNPFLSLNGVDDPVSVADRVFEDLQLDHPYYGAQSLQLLRSVLSLMELAGEAPSPSHVLKYVSNEDELTHLLDRTSTSLEARRLYAHRRQLGREWGKTFSGLTNALSLYTPPGARGSLFEGDGIDLLDILLKKQIVIFHLPVGLYPALSAAVGRILLRQIAALGGSRDAFPEKLGDHPFFVTVDECHVFLSETLAQSLAMLRSARIQFTLAHQDLGQLENISPAFERSVRSNTRTKMILAPRDAEQAEMIARSFGTQTQYEHTFRYRRGWLGTHVNTGDASLREVESFRLHPNALKGLRHLGQGALISPDGIRLLNLEPYPILRTH